MPIIAFIFSLTIGTLLHGYVLSVLWGWFLVPKFGLPVMRFIYIAALITISNFIYQKKIGQRHLKYHIFKYQQLQ